MYYCILGSTWTQEMIWLIGNDLDYEGAKQLQPVRAPLLELSAVMARDHPEYVHHLMGNSVDAVENLTSPRFIKSHLPWELLPDQISQVKPKVKIGFLRTNGTLHWLHKKLREKS